MFKQVAVSAARHILRQGNTEVNSVRNAATKVPLRNTMDDLPIPTGSWSTHYKNQQSKYNMHLAFGVIFAAVSLAAAKAAGVFDLYATRPALKRN